MRKQIKVSIISMKDNKGGGGFTAAYRLLLGLISYQFSANMLVQIKYSNNPKVISLFSQQNKINYLIRILSKVIINFFDNEKIPDQTLAFFNTGVGKKINNFSADIVNLHWVAGEMISIKEIGNISKPVIWTLHDMWPFCGINHLDLASKKGDIHNFFNLDQNLIERKINCWTKPMHIVTPSNWLASCVKKSDLMKNWPITVIPNVIDTSLFKPLDKAKCRKNMMFDDNKTIILFGAFAGVVNEAKGFKILIQALDEISETLPINTELVIFGQDEPLEFKFSKFNSFKWLNHITEEKKMCELYNSADVVVVPSKSEVFGLVAAEAHACGVPVVAFKHTGIQEVVSHKKTGYLARPFECSDFAAGIIWTLKNKDFLSPLARQKACKEWSQDVIIPKYIDLYNSVYEDFKKN